MNHLAPKLSAEIRAATVNFLPYKGGPAVSYTDMEVAYAAAVTLLHLPPGTKPGPESEILIVQKGEGDWFTGVWGSVTGYIDMMSDPEKDPKKRLPDDLFDPIAFTARTELAQECGLSDEAIAAIGLRAGRRFAEKRFTGEGIAHIVPILGLCTGEQKPPVQPDGHELTGHAWVPLSQVATMPSLSPGYLARTLPNTLSALVTGPMEGYREGECLLQMSNTDTRAALSEATNPFAPRGERIETGCPVVELTDYTGCPVRAIGIIGRRAFSFSEGEHCMGYLSPIQLPPEDMWRTEYQAFLADQQRFE